MVYMQPKQVSESVKKLQLLGTKDNKTVLVITEFDRLSYTMIEQVYSLSLTCEIVGITKEKQVSTVPFHAKMTLGEFVENYN